MKRVLKTRHFSRWMRKTGLSDEALCDAVKEMAQGLIAADLLRLSANEIDAEVRNGALQEICHDCQNRDKDNQPNP